jgi:serine/threonine-protein kinase
MLMPDSIFPRGQNVNRQDSGPSKGASAQSLLSLQIQKALQHKLKPTFTVHELLGQGAYGLVYKVWHNDLQRYEVVKVPLGDNLAEGWPDRFLNECRLLAQLQHPGIVMIYGVDELPPTEEWAEGIPFAHLEYCSGGNLDEYRRQQSQGKLAPVEAARLIAEAAEAVARAYKYNIIHRDLKPENILLRILQDGSRQACVSDWGLAVDWQKLV